MANWRLNGWNPRCFKHVSRHPSGHDCILGGGWEKTPKECFFKMLGSWRKQWSTPFPIGGFTIVFFVGGGGVSGGRGEGREGGIYSFLRIFVLF